MQYKQDFVADTVNRYISAKRLSPALTFSEYMEKRFNDKIASLIMEEGMSKEQAIAKFVDYCTVMCPALSPQYWPSSLREFFTECFYPNEVATALCEAIQTAELDVVNRDILVTFVDTLKAIYGFELPPLNL